MSLVTVAEVKAIGRIDYSTHDTEIQLVLDGAESFVEEYCGIRLEAETVTDERQDGGNRQLWPERRPVTAVASIKDAWAGDEVVDTAQYFFTETRIMQDIEDIWDPGELRWKITYTAGYTSSTIPPGLKNAIIGLTLRAYNNAENKASQSAAGYGTSWMALATGDILTQLDYHSMRRYVE
jgi:hypothetical protein